jgi:hypothetical protein
MTNPIPATCFSCFVEFSDKVKPYGEMSYSVNCVTCAVKEIFTYANPHRPHPRTSDQACKNAMFPPYHIELINNNPELKSHLITKIRDVINQLSSLTSPEVRLIQQQAAALSPQNTSEKLIALIQRSHNLLYQEARFRQQQAISIEAAKKVTAFQHEIQKVAYSSPQSSSDSLPEERVPLSAASLVAARALAQLAQKKEPELEQPKRAVSFHGTA